MVFTPPRKDRFIVYLPTQKEPYSYQAMKDHIARNPYWIEDMGEIRGRENIEKLFTMARKQEIDVVYVDAVKDLGSSIPMRLSTAAILATCRVRIMAFNHISFHMIPHDIMQRLTWGFLTDRQFRYYERTARRIGVKAGFNRIPKKRCDAGIPKKGRTQEQKDQIARDRQAHQDERLRRWQATKDRWRAAAEAKRAKKESSGGSQE